MAWTPEEVNEIYAKVMQKATTDESFRSELLANPNAAISKLTGEPLPEDYKIKVLENDPNYTATFVLPNLSTGEIDLDNLEKVVGGSIIIDACGMNAAGNIK
ncbi:MAG: NHLP leader peptide family RiPP precursor [Lactobacillales bacterium]|jgi:hypothetical protein|nr:NHLP leader peptide family RiPP precursor [Lactobacillales bacterium]